MKSRIFWMVIISLFYQVKAQEIVKGVVLDSLFQTYVEGAEVQLIKKLNNEMVEWVFTDSVGYFEFNMEKRSDFYIKIEGLGFQSKTIENLEENNSIYLEADVQNLGEAVIRTTHNTRMENGNLVVIVANNREFKTSTNLFDVLRRTPGVRVDQDELVYISGGAAATLFVDGKPLQMSQNEMQNYLRSLTPEIVESIEIIANPSSKYDAEYKGIINIRLKHNKNLGLKGTYAGNTLINRYLYLENNLAISYNAPKSVFTANLGYSDGTTNYKYNARQILASEDILITTNDELSKLKIQNLQLGWEYRLNPNHLFSLNVRGNKRDNFRFRNGELYATNSDASEVVFNTVSVNLIDNQQENLGGTIEYTYSKDKFQLDIIGNVLSVKNKQNDDFINREKSTQELISHWKSDLTNDINIQTAQADATYKIGEGSLESGMKYSHSVTNNHLRYDTLSLDNQFEFEPKRSNQFIYKEEILGGYITYNQNFGKLQFNAGIRAENTRSRADAVEMDSIVTREFLNWLPSLGATYKFNDSNEASLSYTSRMTRPQFSQLNPFRYYYSPLNFWIGNPYLKPTVTHQIRASYRYKNYLASLTVGRSNDVMVRYPNYNEKTNELQYLGKNIPYSNFATLEFSVPVKLTKWWNANVQLMGYYNYEYMPYYDEVFAYDLYSYGFRVNQTFSLPGKFSLNVFSNYESKFQTSLYDFKPRYTLDISLQKSWLDNKLNTKLNYTNVFDTNAQELKFRHPEIMQNQLQHWWNTERIVLSLTYTFGSSNYKSEERISTEEERRAQ